jgi:16S rRNA (uracil1498-N3)-methyltransferase
MNMLDRHVNLILLNEHDRIEADRFALSDARAAHLLGVLRVAPGRVIRVGLLEGPRGTGIIETVGDHRVTMRVAFEAAAPERPRVDVMIALPRPKVMHRLWAQLAALGVGQIIVTNASRVERDAWATHYLDERLFRPLLIEGLQQARDTRVPLVSLHKQFKILVEDTLDALFPTGLRLVADPSGTTSLPDAVQATRPERVLLAVGPEGGWNEFELELLEAHGFTRVGLGPRTLRVDTACTALLAIAHAAMDVVI